MWAVQDTVVEFRSEFLETFCDNEARSACFRNRNVPKEELTGHPCLLLLQWRRLVLRTLVAATTVAALVAGRIAAAGPAPPRASPFSPVSPEPAPADFHVAPAGDAGTHIDHDSRADQAMRAG